MRSGPWAGNYWAAVVLVLSALTPYLVLSAALSAIGAAIQTSLHMSAQTFSLANGMANAGYALGTVISVQLSQRLPPRRMLVAYVLLFLVGSALAAGAVTPAMYVAGHVLQGLCTSLMLIAALPPLVAGFPASRLATTNVIVGLGLFGGVAAGPVVGGIQASADGWRPLFLIVLGVGVVTLAMTLLTFQDQRPTRPDSPTDPAAIVLSGCAAAAIFFGAAQLQTHGLLSAIALGPLVGGVLGLLALLVYQYRARNPLLMVRELCTTIPVAAAVIAITAGAASVGVIELAQLALGSRHTPLEVGVLLLPELGGAMLTSLLVGPLLRTKWLILYPFAGAVVLSGGAALLIGVATGPDVLALVGAGLVGLGIGASVAPALIATGFVRLPTELQRVYALLELLRGAAAFAFAPIVVHVATGSASGSTGIGTAMWICFGVAAAGVLITVLLGLTGRIRLQAPEINRWVDGKAPGLSSPPLVTTLRHRE